MHRMSEALRYIIAGIGASGAAWAKFVLPRLATMNKAVCVAAADADPDRLAHAAAGLQLKGEDLFRDPLEAIEKRRADFIVVTAPAIQHERIVTVALAYDLHVLLDSPMADSMEASSRLYRKVRENKKKMVVATAQRLDQDKQSLMHHVNRIDAGRMSSIYLRFAHNFRKLGSWGQYRHDIPNPLFIEAGMQHFDVLRYLAGSNAKRVYATSWAPLWGQFKGETAGMCTIEFENGVHATYDGSAVSGATSNGWNNEFIRVDCEHATYELDARRLRMLAGDTFDRPRVDDLPLLDERQVWGTHWLAEAFCDWLRGGQPPITNLVDNMQTVALCHAAIESAHTGKPIDVQDYLHLHRRIARSALAEERGLADTSGELPGELPV